MSLFSCLLVLIVSIHLTSAAIGPSDVDRLSRAFTDLCDDELHHTDFSQMFSNTSIRYTTTPLDGDVEVQLLSERIATRLESVVNVVYNNSKLIQDSYELSTMLKKTFRADDCCAAVKSYTYDPRFKQNVNSASTCNRLFSQGQSKNRLPGTADFVSKLQINAQTNPGITWQYSGDIDGAYHQYPAANNSCSGNDEADDFRYKSWYVNTVTPKKKNIVLVLDVSGTMFQRVDFKRRINRLDRAKEAANAVLDTLTAKDWTGVVAFNETTLSPPGCYGDKIAQANTNNIGEFNSFIQILKSGGGTNYSAGLSTAFSMLEQAKLSQMNQFDDSLDIIIFLTDGDPNDKPDDIRKVISDGNAKLNNTVRIFYYGVGGSVGVKTNITDLLSFADQNNGVLHTDFLDRSTRKTNHHVAKKWKNKPNSVGPAGHFEIISDKNSLRLRDIMAGYYLHLNGTVPYEATFTMPHVDDEHGLMVTVTKSLKDGQKKFLGVTAADVKFDSLFDQVTYFRKGQHSYAFLVNREGKVLSHRNFARPSKTRRNINFVSLDIAEPSLPVQTVQDIVDGKTGSKKQKVALAMSRGVSRQDGSYKLTLDATYHYRPVLGFERQYSVVIVLFDGDNQVVKRQATSNTKKSKNLSMAQYHKLLDISKKTKTPSNICQTQQGALVNKKTSSIKLAANAFTDPNKYLTEVETIHDLKTLEKLLRDQIVKPNSMLTTDAMEDIIFTSGFDTVTQSHTEAVLRYMATAGGVFRISPGMLIEKYYDAVDQPWYRQSSLYQDRCVVTRAGYSPSGDENLVSISHAILTPQQNMIGSSGADLSVTYLRSLMHTNIPECNTQHWSCSLLDHSGYVVTEPSMGKSAKDGTLKHTHITDVFPEIIQDIINRHPGVIKLSWCRRLQGSMQSQLFYTISTTYTTVGSDPGAAACEEYRLHSLQGTNLHILVTPTMSCAPQGNTQKACKCTDKCTTCNTTVSSCQCPCTCDAGADPCTNRYDVVFPPITCPAPWMPVKPPKMTTKSPPVPDCPVSCHQRASQKQCIADKNCHWCQSTPATLCLPSCPFKAPDATTTPATTIKGPVSSSGSTPLTGQQGVTGKPTKPGSSGNTGPNPGGPTVGGGNGGSTKGGGSPGGGVTTPGGKRPGKPGSPGAPGTPGGNNPINHPSGPGGNGGTTPNQGGPNSNTNTQPGYGSPTAGGGNGAGPTTRAGKIKQTCEQTYNVHPVTVLMKQALPSPVCKMDQDLFCEQHCAPPPVIQSCKHTSEKESEDNYKKLAAGLGVPLAALAALSAIALFALLRKKPDVPLSTPTKIRPVTPFVPNIYRASMGDEALPGVGKKGATLDDWNSNGRAMFGRVSISE